MRGALCPLAPGPAVGGAWGPAGPRVLRWKRAASPHCAAAPGVPPSARSRPPGCRLIGGSGTCVLPSVISERLCVLIPRFPSAGAAGPAFDPPLPETRVWTAGAVHLGPPPSYLPLRYHLVLVPPFLVFSPLPPLGRAARLQDSTQPPSLFHGFRGALGPAAPLHLTQHLYH